MTIIITIVLTLLTLASGVGLFYLGYKHGKASQSKVNATTTKVLTDEEKQSIRDGEKLNKYLNNVLNFKA